MHPGLGVPLVGGDKKIDRDFACTQDREGPWGLHRLRAVLVAFVWRLDRGRTVFAEKRPHPSPAYESTQSLQRYHKVTQQEF